MSSGERSGEEVNQRHCGQMTNRSSDKNGICSGDLVSLDTYSRKVNTMGKMQKEKDELGLKSDYTRFGVVRLSGTLQNCNPTP